MSELSYASWNLSPELDQDLSFKTDTSAVLDMFVSGIYKQPNVFVRELIQNALDATYIEYAITKRHAISYRPKITVTAYQNEDGRLLAVRVDDNGSGMDIADVKDTLLWIGRSQSSKESIQDLLKDTEKHLIANFGVGLLSCFRVASSITIRTQRGETGRSFEVKISEYGDHVGLENTDHDIGGTSALIFLKDEFSGLQLDKILRYYCRMISLADVYSYSVRDDLEFRQSARNYLQPSKKVVHVSKVLV